MARSSLRRLFAGTCRTGREGAGCRPASPARPGAWSRPPLFPVLTFFLLTCVPGLGPGAAGAGRVLDGQVKPVEAFASIEARTGERVTGTGNAVALPGGDFVTACHVVFQADRVLVHRDGTGGPTALVSAVVDADLCVLQRPSDLLVRPIQQRDTPAEAGLPLTLVGRRTDSPRVHLARGTVLESLTVAGVSVILTDAPVPPGFSGAGTFDRNGRLLGIAVGRWAKPAVGVVVDAAMLSALAPAGPDGTAGLKAVPDFLDEARVWPDMLLVGMRMQGAGALRSTAAGGQEGWTVASDNSHCLAVARDDRQTGLALHLDIPRAPGSVPVALSVERGDVDLATATQALTLTLHPSGAPFGLRPARLVQSPDKVAAGLWNARWDLDEAEPFLRALPTARALVVRSNREDLGAMALDPFVLWTRLRDTCL